MERPTLLGSHLVAPGTQSITAYLPVPGMGVLPVNAFVIEAEQPLLVDTGLAALESEFMDCLGSILDLEAIRWIWVTHTDPDHIGNLRAILAKAPNAQVVTTFLGAGKMGLSQLPISAVRLIEPGGYLDVGDRQLLAVTPPCFDAPETIGIFDSSTQVLYSADCFGALMTQPAESAEAIHPAELKEGLITWSRVDAPWLSLVDEVRFRAVIQSIDRLNPETFLSSHLPVARSRINFLLESLMSVCETGERTFSHT